MKEMMARLPDLQSWLDDARGRHKVVGASLAVLHRNELHCAASGVLNLDTQAPVSINTAFQIGSITKVITAALVMQLVDQGKLDLDRPIRNRLAEFSTADPKVVEEMTVRQILSHTAGLEDASHPIDTETSPTIAAYMENTLNPPPCFARPGAIHSYSNNGYVIAGRLIEVLAESDWATAVSDRICAPLGLSSVRFDPAGSDLLRAAVGHMPGTDGHAEYSVAPPDAPLCMAPAGSALAMSASDLLRLVTGRDRILSPTSIKAMESPQVELHAYSPRNTTHWGLGWSLVDHPRHLILSHDGTTPGQAAYLRVLPEAGIAIVLLTNSLSTSLWNELFPDFLGKLADIILPQRPAVQEFTGDPMRYIGVYGATNGGVKITVENGDLHLAILSADGDTPIIEADLFPFAPDSFEMRSSTIPDLGELSFIGSTVNGRATYLSLGFRTLPRRG